MLCVNSVKQMFLGEVLGLYFVVKVIHESLITSNMQFCLIQY